MEDICAFIMENQQKLQEQEQPHQQPKQSPKQQSDENEEMWDLFEESYFFFTDDESIDENKKDIDENKGKDKVKEDNDLCEDENKKYIDESEEENKKDIDVDESIDENTKDIDESMGKDKVKEDIDLSIDEDKKDIDGSEEENKKDINESMAKDKEEDDESIDENKKDIDENMSKDKVNEDIDLSIAEEKEDIDEDIEDKEDIAVSIDEEKEDIDESEEENKKDINESREENKKDIDESMDKDKENIDVSVDESKEDIDEDIVEDKLDNDVSIAEDKKDIAVSIDEEKEDIDEDIAEDKENIDVSVDESKEDIDLTKDENKEDIAVSIAPVIIDEEKEDIWNLFENLFPDDSKSIDISDATGKSIESDNNSMSKNMYVCSINRSLHSDKTRQYFNDADIEIQKNVNDSNPESLESCNERTQEKNNKITLENSNLNIATAMKKRVRGKKKKHKKKANIKNMPKRPSSAFFLWQNENRLQIKNDNPGISNKEVAKVQRELWRVLEDKSKWEEMKVKLKEDYIFAMDKWRAACRGKNGDDDDDASKKAKNVTEIKTCSGGEFKSAEFIFEDSSSDGSGSGDLNDKNSEIDKKPKKEEVGGTSMADNIFAKGTQQTGSTIIPTKKQTTSSLKRLHANNVSESTTAAKQIKLEIPHVENYTTLLRKIFTDGEVKFDMKEILHVKTPEYECHVECKGQKYKGEGKSKDLARQNAADVAALALMQVEYGHEEFLSRVEIVLKKNLSNLLLNKEHIKKEKGGFICNLCSVCLQGKGKTIFEHINGKKHKHKKKEDDLRNNFFLLNKEYRKDEDGNYFCILCSTSYGYENFFKHVRGKRHELNSKESVTDEESLLKIALDKGHVIEESVGIFCCNLCPTYALISQNLLEHVKGEKHKVNAEIDIYWGKELLTEFLLLNKKYIKEKDGKYICNVIDCSTSLFSPKSLHEHVKQENHVLKIELNKGHIKEEELGKYFCNLCLTTLLNTKSLLEHVEGKKHKTNLQLSSKGIFNQSHENEYYKVIEKEVLKSSMNTKESNHLSSMEDIDLKCQNNDSDENKSNKLHIIEEKLSNCEDPIVLEALNLGHLKSDSFGEFTCSMCDVSSTKLSTVIIHLKGKKHKLKSKEFTGDQENGESSSQTVFKDNRNGYFIQLSGLPHTATQHDIKEFFSPVDIVSIRFIVASTEEDLSSHIGEADVEFLSEEDATIAMAKHMSIMNSNIIQLTLISTSASSKRLKNPLATTNSTSLRLVVTESHDVNMSIRTVIVLMPDHATIILESRDYKKLKDINVNDNETVFYVREMGNFLIQYNVRDLGSKGGTLLNGTLISPQGLKQSQYIPVNHGDTIQCGLVTLVCHIHPSSSFCFHCEKETKISAGTSSKLKLMSNKEKEIISDIHRENKKDVLEISRRNALKKIRKKHGLTFMYNMEQEHIPNESDYKDRANKRRKKVGSDNPYEKTEVAHTSIAISSKNKGFKMLASMGWKEGEGLGKDNSGMLEPIRGDEVKDNKTGLGSTDVGGPPLSFKQKEKLRERQKILDITKERYYK